MSHVSPSIVAFSQHIHPKSAMNSVSPIVYIRVISYHAEKIIIEIVDIFYFNHFLSNFMCMFQVTMSMSKS